MSNSQFEMLRNFLMDYAQSLSYYEGDGVYPRFPEFELYARDYLHFAELEIAQFKQDSSELTHKRHLINCIAYLKRAIDCATDTFLVTFNLLTTFNKRNLSLSTKLAFLQEASVFSSYTLSRLNTIRNEMEHEYRIPKVHELEVYFDLASAFVAVLELNMTFASNKRSIFVVFSDKGEFIEGIEVKYNYEVPSICIEWWDNTTVYPALKRDLSNPNEFAFLFKVFVLLHQLGRFTSPLYVKNFLAE
jgi:hypothetical protein